MLSAFGAGEVPISISGDPAAPEPLVHTVRAVGLATQAICDAPRRARCSACADRSAGPGRWREIEGADVIVVAGGIGLAPLRPAILALLARRERYGRLLLLYGGRSPDQLLYAAELEDWTRARARGARHRRQRRARVARPRRRRHAPGAPRRASTPERASRCSAGPR